MSDNVDYEIKVYTQEDFDNFPVIDGIKQCPTGDYRNIKEFKDRCCFNEGCWFSEVCYFSDWCSFNHRCNFGNNCSFGNRCVFGVGCNFGEYCTFGDQCSFSNYCRFCENCFFGESCSFGEWCDFYTRCNFGKQCSFGDYCSFCNSCIFERIHVAKQGYPLLSFNGFGSVNRTTYFFNCEDGIFVRCGCFSGYIDQFRKQVKKTREGEIANEYLAIADFVERKWSTK